MALEDLTGAGKFVTALNAAWPVDDDWVDEGDNHIRGIKNVLKNTFPVSDAPVFFSGAQVRVPDGQAAAPGIAWTNDTDSGFHHLGGGVMRYVVNTDHIFSCDATQFLVAKTLLAQGAVNTVGPLTTTGGSWNGSLATMSEAPVLVSCGTFVPGVTLKNLATARSGMMMLHSGGSLYFGSSVANGPVAGGYGMVMDTNGDVFARSFTPLSDAGLKSNVRQMSGSLAQVLRLRGVRYASDEGREELGLVAQEAEEIFPEAVRAVGGLKAVNYGALVAPLIEAVRELEARVQVLEGALASR